MSFAAQFQAALAEALGTSELSQHAELARHAERIAQGRPTVTLAPEPFARFVAERITSALPSPERLADLHLACAALTADPGGLALFIDTYDAIWLRALVRLGLEGDALAEARQTLLLKLVVDDPRRLRSYRGEGDLAGWLRVSATRLGLNLRRGDQRAAKHTSSSSGSTMVAGDLELDWLAHTYRAAFHQAFASALNELPPRERLLLRQFYVDGVGLEALGQLYGAHRTSVARWLKTAQAELRERISADLKRTLRAGDETVSSVLRLLRAIDASVSGIFS